jgi:hypothetical protein
MGDIMAEDVETTSTDADTSIWDLLEMDDPNQQSEEPYEAEEEEADVETAKIDKMDRKLSAKMDDMQKKFERTIIRDRVSKFEETADDLQKDLFKTIASEVKDVESLDKAMGLVSKRYQEMKKEEDEYKQRMSQKYEEEAAKNWGMGPMGTPTPRTKDEEEKVLEKIATGDTHALFENLMEGNWPT